MNRKKGVPMIGNDLLDIQRTLRNHGLLISFSGRLTQAIIEELGAAVKKYLELEESPKSDIFNIFSIFIEQTQNVKNYCASKEGTDAYDLVSNSCIITIGKTEGGGNYICSGNLVENKEIQSLITKIDSIIPLDKTALKKLYKETLKKEITEQTNGAGLGLIDMARKANEPLAYSVAKVDEHYSFFTLKTIV